MERYISFPMAVLGGTLIVEEIFIQPGIECGSTKTIPGKGFPSSSGVGNLVITFRIEAPKQVGPSLRGILEKLAKELGDDVVETKAGLVEKIKNLLPL